MLSRIDLRYFKCFETLKLPLSRFTLLSGANASRKSVMQALVVLHQTMREHEWSRRLMLNGSTVRLGTAGDVIDQANGHRAFGIRLYDGPQGWFDWEFVGERSELSMAVQATRGEISSDIQWDADGLQPLRYLLPVRVGDTALARRLCSLTYLPAERLGPREHYLHDDPRMASGVGPRGEFAVSAVHSGRDAQVSKNLVIPGVPSTRYRQVEASMAQFFPGCVLTSCFEGAVQRSVTRWCQGCISKATTQQAQIPSEGIPRPPAILALSASLVPGSTESDRQSLP